MIQAGFTAIRHVPLGYTVSVSRFWYLPDFLAEVATWLRFGVFDLERCTLSSRLDNFDDDAPSLWGTNFVESPQQP